MNRKKRKKKKGKKGIEMRKYEKRKGNLDEWINEWMDECVSERMDGFEISHWNREEFIMAQYDIK